MQSVNKKAQSSKLVALFCFRFAEAEGFEPPGRCRPTVFKTAAIDHSATPPCIEVCKYTYFFLTIKKGAFAHKGRIRYICAGINPTMKIIPT